MKEKMMYWQGSTLILTPNKCYAPRAMRAIAAGICFWILSLCLAVRFGDFWQLPFAVGACLLGMSLLYKTLSADIKVFIDAGHEEIEMSYGLSARRKIMAANEALIIKSSLNGKPYFSLSRQNNPYGKSYQISPFLTSKKTCEIFENEVFPVITKQLNLKN